MISDIFQRPLWTGECGIDYQSLWPTSPSQEFGMHPRLLAAMLLIATAPSPLSAVTYSWEGELVSDAGINIWSIEFPSEPFSLTFTVDDDAIDSSSRVEVARFPATNVEFQISGEPLRWVSGGSVELEDGFGSIYDLIHFYGAFEKDGFESGISTLISLPVEMFQFTSPVENPPRFGRTLTPGRAVTQGDFYFSVVDEGEAVTAVPEPPVLSFVMAAFLAATLPHRSRLRYCRGL